MIRHPQRGPPGNQVHVAVMKPWEYVGTRVRGWHGRMWAHMAVGLVDPRCPFDEEKEHRIYRLFRMDDTWRIYVAD